jgi:Protein of unknown function (DUF1761)
MNFLVIFLASLIPLVFGFIWYNPKVLGKAWQNETGLTDADLKGANMLLVFGLSFVFSLLISVAMPLIVIHQMHLNSIVAGDPTLADPNSELSLLLKNFMDKYGNNYRTFKHGMLHGAITAIFTILPVVGTTCLYERKSFKYAAITIGYWVINFTLMGGVICAFS